MATATPDFLQQLFAYLQTNLLTDISADVYPDVDALLAVVETNGVVALLDPANALLVQSTLVKLQADALKVGSDLSKQVATFLRMYFKAKFAPPAAAA